MSLNRLFILSIVVVLAACNNTPDNHTKKISDTATTIISDTATTSPAGPLIAAADAYSNLFTDSEQVQKFISRQQVEAAAADDIRKFYVYRSYQFAWLNDSGFTEQALAFRSLYDYDRDSSTKRTSLDNRMDELVNADSLKPAATDPQIVSTELMMTWRLVNYMTKKLPPTDRLPEKLNALVPVSKRDVNDWISFMTADPPAIATGNKWLEGLQKALQQLISLQKKGGWDTLPISRKPYATKKPSSFFRLLKKRLSETGQLTASDTTNAFTPALAAAIKTAQSQFGYIHDTRITPKLLRALNVPVEERIRQVIVNMVRMQWMPEISGKEYILVNIPEYRLYVMDNGNINFGMDVITGKEGHATVMFSGHLNQIVFSPYWNLPASIVKKEILPKLQKNKHYLKKQDMEIKGYRSGMPVIRQLPGEKNELGKIKFLFPNSQHIYFHDTPHKWLFKKDVRAYSHGCIRLAEPEKLAAYLLADNGRWTNEKIDSAMNSGEEKYVRLKKQIPVLIYYFTAWVDDTGVIQYRNDVYGHDAALGARIFRQTY